MIKTLVTIGIVVFLCSGCGKPGVVAVKEKMDEGATNTSRTLIEDDSTPGGDGVVAMKLPSVAPEGFGQLETAPTMFKGGTDDEGREFYLNGQPASNGKIIFTASNGFFSPGVCRASGKSKLPKVGDENLIVPNYACLLKWKKTKDTIRWHVWITKPGKVRFNVKMLVKDAAAGSQLRASFAGESQNVITVAASPDRSQPWDLVFNVITPGEHMFSIAADKIVNKKMGVGELHTVDVYGPAIEEAQLLRARWRPAAVHGGYASSQTPTTQMWVMTTRSLSDFGSYSPITTPFGYYGTAFGADRRSNGGFNFSMWASSAKGKIPPLEKMPHLLVAGSPEAEFSGFGHEGSGVKLRGWLPMPDKPEICVQALRVENDGKYNTYHGYFWDHPTKRWKVYAVGRKWNKGKQAKNLKPGSFCEVPGPPHAQRTGDCVREVRRHGWTLGMDDAWHTMDTFLCGSKGIFNKFWYITSEGEFAMGCGGMRQYEFSKPPISDVAVPLPEYLSPAATKQLYMLPAEFANFKTLKVVKTGVALDIAMVRPGTNARAEVYYGTNDCLIFAPRKLHGTERHSAVSKSMQSDGRSWSDKFEIASLKKGRNLAIIKGLKPATTYYYRVLVTNDEGRMWSFETYSFTTGG